MMKAAPTADEVRRSVKKDDLNDYSIRVRRQARDDQAQRRDDGGRRFPQDARRGHHRVAAPLRRADGGDFRRIEFKSFAK